MSLYQVRLNIPSHSIRSQLSDLWDTYMVDAERFKTAADLMYGTVVPFVSFGSYSPGSKDAFAHLRAGLFKRWDPQPFRYTTRAPLDTLAGWLRSSPDNPRIFSAAFTYWRRFPQLFGRAMDGPGALELACTKALKLSDPETCVQALRILEDEFKWQALVRSFKEAA